MLNNAIAFLGMLVLFLILGGIGYWQLSANRQLEHRIAAGDESLLTDGAYKVEHIMEAPQGSVVQQANPWHQAK